MPVRMPFRDRLLDRKTRDGTLKKIRKSSWNILSSQHFMCTGCSLVNLTNYGGLRCSWLTVWVPPTHGVSLTPHDQIWLLNERPQRQLWINFSGSISLNLKKVLSPWTTATSQIKIQKTFSNCINGTGTDTDSINIMYIPLYTQIVLYRNSTSIFLPVYKVHICAYLSSSCAVHWFLNDIALRLQCFVMFCAILFVLCICGRIPAQSCMCTCPLSVNMYCHMKHRVRK